MADSHRRRPPAGGSAGADRRVRHRAFHLHPLLGFALAGALTVPGQARSVRVPAAAFAQSAQFQNLRLSPDGNRILFTRGGDDPPVVYVARLAEGPALRRTEFKASVGPNPLRSIDSCFWVGRDRILAAVTPRFGPPVLVAENPDGSGFVTLSGYDRGAPTGSPAGLMETARFERPLIAPEVLFTPMGGSGNVLLLRIPPTFPGEALHPDVIAMDTTTAGYSVVARNPGRVIQWTCDDAGEVRLGLTLDASGRFGLVWRPERGSEWIPVPPDPGGPTRLIPLAFDFDGRRAYVAGVSPLDARVPGRWSVYRLDPRSGSVSGPVFEDREYDVASAGFVPIAVPQLFFSARRRTLAGVGYVAQRRTVAWLDPDDRALQADLDQALPGTDNVVVQISGDERRWLVLSQSDREPGFYSVFDVDTRRLLRIGSLYPELQGVAFARMEPIEYISRDGLTIHGYLTRPPGAPPGPEPLVLLPHGGPAGRDILGFDPLVQFLANRGYAVLSVEYRGSLGFGERFQAAGRRQVGGAIQTDIEDGARWAIASGIADPHRMAIVGASFGGYCALFAAAHSSSLYRCAVSVAGVTDWYRLLRRQQAISFDAESRYWNDEIGDPRTDAERLRAISPIGFAARIHIPILLIHGADDEIVPVAQAREMAAALRRVGTPVQSDVLPKEGHAFLSPATRTEYLQALERFLAQHL